MRVEITDRLGVAGPRWDELVASDRLPSPFLRSWWLEHAATGRAAIVCCWDGDDLLGGAAFELDRIGRGRLSIERVRMLGQGPLAPDHLDVVAAPGHDGAVTEAVLRWLHRPGTRVVDLDGLSSDGRLGRSLATDVIDRVGAPFATLTPDAAAYLAGRPGKVRSTIQRTRRRFDREGVELRRVELERADEALDRLAELHDGRWADESDFLSGWARFSAAARSGMSGGDVVIHELVAPDGNVIASELDLVVGTRTAFYQAGRLTDRDWRGSGSVLRMGIIDEVIGSGGTEYDLLRGDESYKQEWATDRRELVRVRFPVATPARLLLGAHSARVVVERRLAERRLSDPEPSPPASGARPEQSD